MPVGGLDEACGTCGKRSIDATSGVVQIKIPTLIHDFSIGIPGKAPATIAHIMFTGDTDSMRQYGRLVRDSANAAANRAEGKGRR